MGIAQLPIPSEFLHAIVDVLFPFNFYSPLLLVMQKVSLDMLATYKKLAFSKVNIGTRETFTRAFM